MPLHQVQSEATTMPDFALRVKTKQGQQVIRTLTAESTIKELKNVLSVQFDIPENRLHVLKGFPPKPFDMRQDHIALNTSGLSSGDTLILEEKEPPPEPLKPEPPKPAEPKPATTVPQTTRPETTNQDAAQAEEPCEGILMKRVVPADNSCLFSSIHFVLNGKLDDTGTAAPYMRQLIAETIQGSPDEFTEALLGKSNADYCKWIRDENSWGGAIEIAILSSYYGIEIAAVDTTSTVINRFGEDKNYPHRALLLFDGIHYDPLYLESFDGQSTKTIFPSDNENILRDAKQLAQEANSSRQFTDLNKFTLKCIDCNVFLTGSDQARQHCQSTGHQNFGEI